MIGGLEKKLVILSGRAGRNFSKRVIDYLIKSEKVSQGFQPGDLTIGNFANRELNFKLETHVREKTAYVIQSVRQGPKENIYLHEDIFEVLVLNDLLSRAGVTKIVDIFLHMPYLRQDRKAEGREPITAKMLFNILVTSSGGLLKRIIVGDMHNKAEQGFADIPIDDVPSYPLFLLYYKQHPELKGKDLCIVSPDVGGVKRADYFAKLLGADLAIIDKRRKKGEEAKAMHVIGDVEGKYCIMIDDMIDGGGTMIKGAQMLREYGARSRIYVCATHGLFNKKGEHDAFAEERFFKENIEVLVTDSILRSQHYRDTSHKWLRTISIAPVIGDMIYCDMTGQSVTSVLNNYEKKAMDGTDSIDNYLIPITPKEL